MGIGGATFRARCGIHGGFGEASAICLKSDLFVAAQKTKRENAGNFED